MLLAGKRRGAKALYKKFGPAQMEGMTLPLSSAYIFVLDCHITTDFVRHHGEVAKCLVGCSLK